jgi:hypothetical protein
MKKMLFALAGLVVAAGLAVLFGPGGGRAQDQPGAAPNSGGGVPGDPQAEAELLKPYVVTPAAGPWMICVSSYSSDRVTAQSRAEAARNARELVEELQRSYNLRAYVFNRGAEERLKEKERVEKAIQQRRAWLQQMQAPPDTPIHVKRVYIEDQYAVLVGGYKDMATARRALEDLKKLKPVDHERVRLATVYVADPKEKQVKLAHVNPLTHGFVVRNPSLPAEHMVNLSAHDPFLIRLNADESFSLLKCPRRLTLAVKQFQGANTIESKATANMFQSKAAVNNKSAGELLNAAAVNAHNLAEALRKIGFEAYVLHTRYTSVVTVGGYDSVEDPRMHHMQQQLASLHLDPRLQMFAEPLPMEIPRP